MSILLQKDLRTTDDTKNAVQDVIRIVRSPVVFLINGPLGAGKTKFVQLCVEALGGQHVSSPTFALHQAYSIANNKTAHHFDLYRMEHPEELDATGFWDIIQNEDSFIFIEWPDHGGDLQFPRKWDVIHVDIQMDESGKRNLKLSR